MKKGGRNLIILGAGAIIIALLSTGVSLYVYHDSGDIYIDLSRPDLMNEKENIKQENNSAEEKYKFADEGSEIIVEELDEYLLKLGEESDKLNATPNPYSLESISDENLLDISE